MGRQKGTEEMPKRHTCPKPKGCGKSYPYTKEYFHINNQQKWGLHPYCKECRNKHRRNDYAAKTMLQQIKAEQKQGLNNAV